MSFHDLLACTLYIYCIGTRIRIKTTHLFYKTNKHKASFFFVDEFPISYRCRFFAFRFWFSFPHRFLAVIDTWSRLSQGFRPFSANSFGSGHEKETHTAKTKYRNFETNIPRKGISGPQSQFPHSSSVSDLYIPTIGLPILLEELCGPILGLYKSLTDTWMLKLGLRPRYSQKRNM